MSEWNGYCFIVALLCHQSWFTQPCKRLWHMENCNVVRQVSSRIPTRQCRLKHCKVHIQIDILEVVHFQLDGANKGTVS